MCDMIPMKITHILLGQPWLFDQNVQHNGKENTYALMVGEREVVLNPMTLGKMDKFKVSKLRIKKKVSKPKVIEGKDLEAKISGVATIATKIKPGSDTKV